MSVWPCIFHHPTRNSIKHRENIEKQQKRANKFRVQILELPGATWGYLGLPCWRLEILTSAASWGYRALPGGTMLTTGNPDIRGYLGHNWAITGLPGVTMLTPGTPDIRGFVGLPGPTWGSPAWPLARPFACLPLAYPVAYLRPAHPPRLHPRASPLAPRRPLRLPRAPTQPPGKQGKHG